MLDAGMIGAIVGSTVGVAGGAFGTWMSIRHSPPGPRRRLMVKASIACWIFVLSFVALVLFLPTPWKWWLWALYGPVLLLLILSINRALADVRTAAKQPTAD